MADRLAVQREARRAVREVALVLLLADREAEVRAVAAAVDALAALRREERDDVIAGRERRDALADLLDDAGALVPEHGRRVAGRIGARGGVEIGVADAAGDEAHEHLAGARLGQLDLAHDERLPELLEDGGSDLHQTRSYDRHSTRRDGSRPRSARAASARPARAARGRPGGRRRPSSRRSGAPRSRAARSTTPPGGCRRQRRGFYTIGSAGHESNAYVALALRPTDPALLHYRSGAFYLARAGQAGRDGAWDVLLGMAAAVDEPIAGGRHKVFGHHDLGVIPQTSTIASHLPRAVGIAFAIERAAKLGVESPMAADASRRLLVRRCVAEPRVGTDRIEQRGAHRVPGHAVAASVRLRGQRARDQRPDAGRLGRAVAARRPQLAVERRRRRPCGRSPRPVSSPTGCASTATRPSSISHGPLPQSRRRRRRDRVPSAAGDPRRLRARPAARDRALARGDAPAERRAARARLPRRRASGSTRARTRRPASRSSTAEEVMRPLAPRRAP